MIRLTLYGCPETPSCNHFKKHNARSIKPSRYAIINLEIINYTMQIKKESGASGLVILHPPRKDIEQLCHYKLHYIFYKYAIIFATRNFN